MKQKPLWSIVVIAKNEEKTLPRLLDSLAEFIERGGEVIVLDTGSNDATMDIALSYGCTVHQSNEFYHKINDQLAQEINEKFLVGKDHLIFDEGKQYGYFDFASARNYAHDLASNRHVSMPDCDEVFTALDINYVNNVIRGGVDQLEFNFVFSHHPDGSEAIKFRQCKFYNRSVLQWKGIIHEVLQPYLSKVPRVIYLPEDKFKIEHYQNVETNRSGYLTGLAIDCYLNPDNDRNSHYFARELMYSERFFSAINEFRRHIAFKRWPQEVAQSMIFMGDCWGKLNEPLFQVIEYNNAIYNDGTRREPFIKLARFYQHNNKPSLAAAYASAALEIPYNDFYANQMSHYTYEPYEILYWAKGWMGDIKGAREAFMKAWHFNKEVERDAHYYFPFVSIIAPTVLERAKGYGRLFDSYLNLNYPRTRILINISINEEQTVPQKVNGMINSYEGDTISNPFVFVYAADDMEFEPDCLLNAIDALDHHELVSFNEGPLLPDHGNICTHFAIKKSLIEKLEKGQVFSEDFHHVGCDNYLWAQASKLGQAFWCEKAKITHHHFSKPGEKFDDVYLKGWRRVEEDRETLRRKLAELNEKP